MTNNCTPLIKTCSITNSYSAIKRKKKYEKTTPTAKSKETYPSIKTKFLNITNQCNDNNTTLEYHERCQCDQGAGRKRTPLKDHTVSPQFSVALKAIFASSKKSKHTRG